MPRPAQIYLQLPNLVTLSLSMLLCLTVSLLSLSLSLSLALSISRSLAQEIFLLQPALAPTLSLSFFLSNSPSLSLSFNQQHTLSPLQYMHTTHTLPLALSEDRY